ncbi:hypothetical protein AB0O28_36565 [Microbispora sp. NPDC088329]|uniref:hypothetical protein n=1 Tax=Microbispora sp. NPDC088329 TaxID=3154869 RepID=UPI00343535C2
MGIARPADGGHVVNGRWRLSSDTGRCDWIFLGGMLGDAGGRDGRPVRSMNSARGTWRGRQDWANNWS